MMPEDLDFLASMRYATLLGAIVPCGLGRYAQHATLALDLRA